jgi:hypothetical protein
MNHYGHDQDAHPFGKRWGKDKDPVLHDARACQAIRQPLPPPRPLTDNGRLSDKQQPWPTTASYTYDGDCHDNQGHGTVAAACGGLYTFARFSYSLIPIFIPARLCASARGRLRKLAKGLTLLDAPKGTPTWTRRFGWPLWSVRRSDLAGTPPSLGRPSCGIAAFNSGF